MFTQVDSVMWQIFSTVAFVALAVFCVCLILYIIIFICILIKRMIFDSVKENTTQDQKESKDAVVGFALQNKNIRRE